MDSRALPQFHDRPFWLRYGVAAGYVAAAVTVCMGLKHLVGNPHPFTLFIPVVLAAAWYGGSGPAVMALVGAALLGDYLLVQPTSSAGYRAPAEITRLVNFAVTALLCVVLLQALRAGYGRIAASAQDARDHALHLEEEIVKRCEIEKTLRQSEARLAEAKEAAETANRAKDRFLAMLSHELRTPLTPVLAAVSLLETDRRLDDDLRQDMEIVRRNVELEVRLIDELLDLTRIVHGKLELRREQVDMHRMIDHAMVFCCHSDVHGKQLQVKRQLEAADRHVWGDPARLEQILWNLMKNAVKFTPSPGRIDIRTCNPRPGMLRIEVSDTGMGIDPAYLDRIFDAFEQGGRSITRSFGGMGLGLAICKRLVHLHDGTIQAASPGCGQGSTFTVELATLPQRTEQRASLPEQTAGTAMPSDAPASRLRVLLVEDHADTAHIVQQVLCALGHDVRAAGDAASALALMARERFQLLISDLGLPDGSGLDLMRKLRTADGAIRGIALSGYGTEEDIRRSREAGFGVHLTKPISAASLAESVSAATGSTDRAATDAPGMQT